MTVKIFINENVHYFAIIFFFTVGTACDHLGFSVALKVPIFVVVTKADLCSELQVRSTVKHLETILKSPGCNLVPFEVKSESDACTAALRFADK